MSAEEIAAKIKREQRPTPPSSAENSTLPPSPSDPVRDLLGDHDLVFPVHAIDDHTTGPDRNWLRATTFPQQLRQGGWV